MVEVGNVLLKNLAVLFPNVYDTFVKEAIKYSATPTTEMQVKDDMPRRCALSRLVAFFGKHLVYECKQRTCGMILYRRGTDLEVCLAKSLKLLQGTGISFLSLALKGVNPNPEMVNSVVIENFCSKMNIRVQQQIAKITEADATSPTDISTFSVEDTISAIDPDIWKMVVFAYKNSYRKKEKYPPKQNQSKKKIAVPVLCVCHVFCHKQVLLCPNACSSHRHHRRFV